MTGEARWSEVLDLIDDAAKLVGLDPDIHGMLRAPQRMLEVSVPVRRDDGRIDVFTGWRVHHDTTRGPGKGGIRFHPDLDRSEVHRARRGHDVQDRARSTCRSAARRVACAAIPRR